MEKNKKKKIPKIVEKLKTFKGFLVKNPKRLVIAVILLVALIVVAVKVFPSKKRETQVQTTTVEKGTIVSSVTASGTIVSSNIENVTTQASGTVSKVYVKDGDTVYKGQKLAEIDLDVQGQQNYASAYSSYLSAANSLNAAQNSYRSTQASLEKVYDDIKGHDSDETFAQKETRTKAEVANDNAYDSLKSAQAKLVAASLEYQTNTPVITSPVSGVVKSVTVAEGINIGAEETSSGSRANQRIATISTGGLPIATFNVSEIDVLQIKPDQKATITLDAITDKTFTGKVVSVDRVGSNSNNVTTYPVIIQFDTSADEILPNMAATANIVVDSKSDTLTVPSSAISYENEAAFVTILKGDKQTSQKVEVGISSDTEVEILSGLSEGDVVVTGTVSTSSTTTQGQSGGSGLFSVGGGSGAGRMMR